MCGRSWKVEGSKNVGVLADGWKLLGECGRGNGRVVPTMCDGRLDMGEAPSSISSSSASTGIEFYKRNKQVKHLR